MRWALLLAGAFGAALIGSAAAAAQSRPVLTPDGLGPVRIGMSEAEAVRRFGMVSTVVDGDCHHIEFPDRPFLSGIARAGRLASLLVFENPRVRTDRGLRIGSSEAAVRRAYGDALKVEPNAYEDPPAHYLTHWARPGRGVMYETDPKGVVTALHAGDETIGWTDGCG